MHSPTLASIPPEVLTDNILLRLPLRDLIAISACDKYLAILCNSDALWQRKLRLDYDFTVPRDRPLENVSLKTVYQRIGSPRLFVWKCEHITHPVPSHRDFCELKVDRRVVSLVATHSAFYALDDEGKLYAWGEKVHWRRLLTYKFPFGSEVLPVHIKLPTPIRAISCGSIWITAIDTFSHVWFIPDWKQAYRIVNPMLEQLSSEAQVAQVESGWRFIAILTRSGELHVVQPRSGIPNPGQNLELNGSIIWNTPLRLATMPPLPNLPAINVGEEEALSPKLVKIAASEATIIGLTDQGHVLQLSIPVAVGESILFEALECGKIQWEYLPFLSEVEKVRTDPMYSPPETEFEKMDPWTQHVTRFSRVFGRCPPPPYGFLQMPPRIVPTPPCILKISEIFISDNDICAYSTGPSSTILIGSTGMRASDRAEVFPAHQNRPVAHFARTEHTAAFLTPQGKIMGWERTARGKYADEPSMMTIPDSTKGWLFLSITAAGCHFSGLAIEWEELDADTTNAYESASEDEGDD
ncbi:hypothetical protein BOTBODRAFT_175227 [Botryobasidium botryosum FD-172 SS1]|uniref:F-box domain-containing protein n=1 Tax=Botryobasidium botryosum (strain FD-172 SS1) TaxID=930990 RepID=A0A067MPL3_BOTB1|nr:hypothetical protein BOTBODRAFT_175227 [Botryobasidium botryosum FD-172 SS1]